MKTVNRPPRPPAAPSQTAPKRAIDRELLAAIGLTLVCALAYTLFFLNYKGKKPIQFERLIPSIPIVGVYLLGIFSLMSGRVVEFWRRKTSESFAWAWLYPLVGVSLYLLYALLSGTLQTGEVEPRRPLSLALYVIPPVLLARQRKLWADWLFALCLWLPIQTKMLSLPRVPSGQGLQIEMLCAFALALWCLLIIRQLERFEVRFQIEKEDFKLGVKLFAFAALVIMPIGLVSGFLRWQPFSLLDPIREASPVPFGILILAAFLAIPVGFYFSVALVEEILFRGVIQNLLQQTFARFQFISDPQKVAWLLGALLFGAAHSRDPHGLIYVLQYMAFATFAGAIYGYAYLKTGRLTAGAICHALIDTFWLLLFNPKVLPQ